MFKYMKYEIKGTYKFMLGVMILVLGLFTGIYAYTTNMGVEGSALGGIFIGLSFLVLFGTQLATFLFIVNSFKKELYEDRGYLTFTLPMTGYQLVGSKLIIALFWFLLLGTVTVLYNFLMMFIFTDIEAGFSQIIEAISPFIQFKSILFWFISLLFVGIGLLITIYFSMTIGRITIRNKRIGGFWFIIFLVLTFLIMSFQTMITDAIPYYFDFNLFSFGTIEQLATLQNMEYANEYFYFNITAPLTTFNIAGTFYSVIVVIALFVGTSYLVERKIDL